MDGKSRVLASQVEVGESYPASTDTGQVKDDARSRVQWPGKWWLLWLLACVVKFAAVLYFVAGAPADRRKGRFSILAGDTNSYLGAIDNFIRTGSYFFWNGQEEVRAGRLPHYGLLYYLFRQFFSEQVASDLLVFVHMAVEAAAVVVLARIAEKYSSRLGFWIAYVLGLMSLYLTFYTPILMPESFSISLLIFSLAGYERYRDKRQSRYLALTGILLAWLIVLKPYLAPLLALVFIEVNWSGRWWLRAQQFRSLILSGILLAAPVLILLMPWIVRNYIVLGKFVPLQSSITAGYNYTEADFAFRRFVQAWGGSIIFWDKRSAGCYFQPQEGLPCEFSLPAFALAPGYTREEIEAVRSKYIALQRDYSAPQAAVVAAEFDRLTELYRRERAVDYYLIAPLRLSRELVFHSGSYYLPRIAVGGLWRLLELALKLAQSALYYIALIFGTIGLLLIVRLRKGTLLYIGLPVYLLVFFAVVVRIPEFRYFVHAYPVQLIGLTVLGVGFIEKFKLYRRSKEGNIQTTW